MPELPEVETVRRTLAPAVGAKIASVWLSGQGLHMARKPPARKLRGLVGARLTQVRRHGKYLLLDTDGPSTILVHLGMTGRLLLQDAGAARAAHTHVVFGLGARDLRYSDARRFGQVDVVPRGGERTHPALAGLGPDALEDAPDAAGLLERARTKRTSLKAFVLDQGVLAGVGNIYASEALWRARLAPTQRTSSLTAPAAKRLTRAIREVLVRALEHGGTTLADFMAADGAAGENAAYLWVYGRAGEPCPRCRTALVRTILQGRATFHCPSCQQA